MPNLTCPHQAPIMLIVAGSGRMLAQAARDMGLTPLVIDLFNDRDTRKLAEKTYPVASLDQACLMPVFKQIKQDYAVDYACYGSGLENYPDSLILLDREFNIAGNEPAVVHRIQEKIGFFRVLDRLAIKYPESVFIAPEDREHWLIKPMSGQGGLGIQRYTRKVHRDQFYWQRYLDGQAGSVLFLADGYRSRIIGFNTQWCHRVDEQQDFVFSGVINQSPLTGTQEHAVADWVALLVAEFGLKGLNSLDFMVNSEQVSVLEINPRPSASMQLYDVTGLLNAHITSGLGRSRQDAFRSDGFCAYQVVFAERDVLIPWAACWPCQVVDIPDSGSLIRRGAPLCGLIVRNASIQGVLETIKASRQKIFQMLYKG